MPTKSPGAGRKKRAYADELRAHLAKGKEYMREHSKHTDETDSGTLNGRDKQEAQAVTLPSPSSKHDPAPSHAHGKTKESKKGVVVNESFAPSHETREDDKKAIAKDTGHSSVPFVEHGAKMPESTPEPPIDQLADLKLDTEQKRSRFIGKAKPSEEHDVEAKVSAPKEGHGVPSIGQKSSPLADCTNQGPRNNDQGLKASRHFQPQGLNAELVRPKSSKVDILQTKTYKADLAPPQRFKEDTSQQPPPIRSAHKVGKKEEVEEDLTNKTFFDKWPEPLPRARPGPPTIRHAHLTNLPIDCNLAAVQGLVWGGPLETIEFVRKSGTAKIGFLSPVHCEKYWQDTTTGVQFPGKGLQKFHVERADEALPLPFDLRDYDRKPLRRCLRITNMGRDWTMDYLKKVAEGPKAERPTENVVVHNPPGQPTWALLRFMNIRDAIEFKIMMPRGVDWVKHDPRWKMCDVEYARDPCEMHSGLHS